MKPIKNDKLEVAAKTATPTPLFETMPLMIVFMVVNADISFSFRYAPVRVVIY